MTATSQPAVSRAERSAPERQLAQADVLGCAASRIRRLHRDGNGDGVAHRRGPDRSWLLPADPRRLTAIAVIVVAAYAKSSLGSDERQHRRGRGRGGGCRTRSGPAPLALVAFIVAAAVFVALLGVLGAALAGIALPRCDPVVSRPRTPRPRGDHRRRGSRPPIPRSAGRPGCRSAARNSAARLKEDMHDPT